MENKEDNEEEAGCPLSTKLLSLALVEVGKMHPFGM